MLFAWDEQKRQSNVLKHRLDLVRGAELFDGRPTISYPPPRGDEMRVVTIGLLADLPVAVVWSEREGTVRLISLRRAEKWREKSFCGAPRRMRSGG